MIVFQEVEHFCWPALASGASWLPLHSLVSFSALGYVNIG